MPYFCCSLLIPAKERIMRAVRAIVIPFILMGLLACATTGPGGRGSGTVIYENDFSADDGAFEFHGGEVNRIEDGVLHLKQGDAEDIWTVLSEPLFGNYTDTTFRIKFGDPVSAHLNFLLIENSRLLIHVKDNGIYFGSQYLGENVAGDGLEVSL